ncbi:MAG: hypothetical protein K6G81_00560 [Lachnospiraceae bacterium]|nr:hypothetical protein [Lachnospiraceae bacterium]
MSDKKKQNAPGGLPEGTRKLAGAIYRVCATVSLVLLTVLLIATVLGLPDVGQISNPDNNEVSARYIEKGLEETGAVNIVAGMILDYRAFDTFGESNVLFVATICVMVMLRLSFAGTFTAKESLSRKDGEGSASVVSEEEASDRFYEPMNDTILQVISKAVVPIIIIFGLYVVLNGHISPGGGFSGGAIIGAGMILFLNAYGFERTERFMNAKTVKWVTFISLMVYCLAKSYSFFTGANHLESHIPLGTPGAILSSGLILILNICVGLVVACTMYSFYALVRRGRI